MIESEAFVSKYHGISIHKKFITRDKSKGKSIHKYKGR